MSSISHCFIQVKSELCSVIGELQLTSLPVLSDADWSTMATICSVLKIFDEMTIEMSAEKDVTVSKLLVLIDAANEHLNSFSFDDADSTEVAKMVRILQEKFSSRSMKYGKIRIITEATLLDPRFKKSGFPNIDCFIQAERDVTNLAGNILANNIHICV